MSKSIKNDYFGKLNFNEGLNRYETNIQYKKNKIKIDISLDECDDENIVINLAVDICKNINKWAKKAEDYAISELLDLKNNSWLDENEKEVTPEKFRKKMKLESITIFASGDFDFWHNDGDLFWGHFIELSGNIIEGFNYADIPG